ncbi:AAA family ATPase [Fibrobacter sp.]|uniref:AAA family ATPase n=1 Tax=Fibrobacter sp. TaxID=35828 RepID=UPI00386DFA94
MFQRIEKIENYGKFSNQCIGSPNWGGALRKVNVVYAPNGSGKTSLSVMFRSLKEDPELVNKKKSFSSEKSPNIRLRLEGGRLIKFCNGSWDYIVENIVVFDNFYIEDNIYLITLKKEFGSLYFFELQKKEEIQKIAEDLDSKKRERGKLADKRKNFRRIAKQKGWKYEVDKRYIAMTQGISDLDRIIKQKERERNEITMQQRDSFREKINLYLSCFSDSIEIMSLTLIEGKILYSIKINGQIINTKDYDRYSLKYSLSEGDKNALSLSFFLAKLDMIPNLKDFFIVIDDPFTSFDQYRKLATINKLVSLSSRINQMLLLTHDQYFARDFYKKCEQEKLSLQLTETINGSVFQEYDIEDATMTGITKDIKVLNEYLTKGAKSQTEMREIARCIRPSIEGIIRLKFYQYVNQTEWLGDFIKKIKESTNGSPFYRLKNSLDEIREINDFSKVYHHSNPSFMEEPISNTELKNYVKRTLKLIMEKI